MLEETSEQPVEQPLEVAADAAPAEESEPAIPLTEATPPDSTPPVETQPLLLLAEHSVVPDIPSDESVGKSSFAKPNFSKLFRVQMARPAWLTHQRLAIGCGAALFGMVCGYFVFRSQNAEPPVEVVAIPAAVPTPESASAPALTPPTPEPIPAPAPSPVPVPVPAVISSPVKTLSVPEAELRAWIDSLPAAAAKRAVRRPVASTPVPKREPIEAEREIPISTPMQSPAIAETLIGSSLPEWKGVHSGVQAFREVVIQNDQEWHALWKEHAGAGGADSGPKTAPKVDFNEFVVVGVFDGAKPAGTEVSITSTEEVLPPALNIYYKETEGNATSSAAQVYPYHIWVIYKTSLPIQFKKQ